MQIAIFTLCKSSILKDLQSKYLHKNIPEVKKKVNNKENLEDPAETYFISTGMTKPKVLPSPSLL